MSRTDGAAGGDAVPEVTVVMPVFNGTRFLRAQVESILRQEGVSVRLVMADDGSTDGSAALMAELAAGEPRVRLLPTAGRRGLMPTLSALLRAVETDFFALADQDDVWDRDKLARSVRCLAARGGALVYSDVRLIDASGRVTLERYLKGRGLRPVEGRDPVPFIFRNPAIGHTLVGRGDVARAVGEIDPALRAHEVFVIARACRIGAVVFLDEVTGSYRQHGANAVGARRGLAGRLWHLFGPDWRIRLRQETRAAAILALAGDWGELRPLAEALQRGGVRRLAALPGLARLVWRRRDRIGWTTAAAEVLFFVLPMGRAGIGRADGGQTPC